MNSLGVASPLSVKSEYTEACLLSQTNFGSHQLPTIYHFCCSFMVVLSLETTVSAYAPAKTPFLNNKMGYGAPKSSTNSTIPMVSCLQSTVAVAAMVHLFRIFSARDMDFDPFRGAFRPTRMRRQRYATTPNPTQQQAYNHNNQPTTDIRWLVD